MGSGLLFKVFFLLCEFVGIRSNGEWATIFSYATIKKN